MHDVFDPFVMDYGCCFAADSCFDIIRFVLFFHEILYTFLTLCVIIIGYKLEKGSVNH